MQEEVEGWGLEQALEALRADLTRASQASSDGVKFPIASVTVELKVVATKNKGGKAGFKIPFIETEIGAELSHAKEMTNTMTIVLGTPVDQLGREIRVGETGAQLKR